MGLAIAIMELFIILFSLAIMMFYLTKINRHEAQRKAEFRYIDTCYKFADLVIKEDKIRDPKKILAIYEQVEKDIDAYRAKHR